MANNSPASLANVLPSNYLKYDSRGFRDVFKLGITLLVATLQCHSQSSLATDNVREAIWHQDFPRPHSETTSSSQQEHPCFTEERGGLEIKRLAQIGGARKPGSEARPGQVCGARGPFPLPATTAVRKEGLGRRQAAPPSPGHP